MVFSSIILVAFVAGSSFAIHGFTVNSVSSNPISSNVDSDGLRLQLSLSSEVMALGDGINITLAEYNSLPIVNNVTAKSDWALPSFLQGICSKDLPPILVSVFYGHYSLGNITSATAVPLIPPGFTTTCLHRNFNYFVFQPLSDEVRGVRIGSSSEGGPFTFDSHLAASTVFSGYYVTTQTQSGPNGTRMPAFVSAHQGTYTVAAGDEWGNLVLSYFEVL